MRSRRLFGVGATCWTPLACMEIRGTGPSGTPELRSRAAFPDPVSFDRPLPVLRPSRIPDGFPRFALSCRELVLLLRRQRPGEARHSQRNCNEHPRLARQHTGQPRVRRLATSGGVPYDRHRARDQKPPEVALAHLGYLAQPGLAAGRVLPWNEPEPCGEVAPAPKALHRRCEGLQRHRSDWPDPRYRHEAHRLLRPGGRWCAHPSPIRVSSRRE